VERGCPKIRLVRVSSMVATTAQLGLKVKLVVD